MVSSLFTSLQNKAFLWGLALCIFLLPFQIKVLVFEAQWGNGLANPYTSFFVSFFDIALVFTSLAYLIFEKKKPLVSPPLPLMLFLSLAALSVLLSPYNDSLFHFLLVLKLLEGLLFFSLLQQTASKDLLIKVFIAVMCIETLWAIGQILFQQDFGLQILGESVLSESTVNLARFSSSGIEFIRGYGSFPHPNILGGFLVLSILLTLQSTLNKKGKNALLILQILGLLTTFSRSALLALLLTLCFTTVGKSFFPNQKNRYLFISIITIFFGLIFIPRGFNLLSDPALLERFDGYIYSWEMIKAYPLGVGYSHFTLFLDTVSSTALQPWNYQPVHNIFVLGLTELGLPFFFLFVLGCIYLIKKKPVLGGVGVMIITFGLFDHYLLTQDQGRFFFLFALSLLTMKEAVFHKTSADPK